MFRKLQLRNVLSVAPLLMALFLLGSINFEPRTIHAQSSVPNATPPFNGWLVPAGGHAQVPYHTEISMDPSSSSFTLEGWVYNPPFPSGNNYGLVYKSSSFLFETDTTSWSGTTPPFVTNTTNMVILMQCSYLCSGTLDTLSSCTGFGNPCRPTGWFHFAYVYDKPSNRWMLFWNGTKYDDNVATPSWSAQPIILSNAQKMDEFRISNNVRYSSSFTVPSGPFVCDANTMALWHFDEVQGSTTFHDSCGATDNVMTGSSGAHTEGVTGQATSTTLVSSANPSGVGHPVTFTATVSGSGGTPTGTVAFKDGGTDITGCGAQSLSSGQATCSTSSLTVGPHNITAVYSGDTVFAPSTSPGLIQTAVVMYDLYLPLITK
jgi:Bacterial Ig-like domain (group 3)